MCQKICSVEGCNKPIGRCGARGMCPKHYAEWCHNNIDKIKKKRIGCLVPGCKNKHYAHGYCEKHNARIKTKGNPSYSPIETLRGETWAKINGFGDRYYVSTLGRVKSVGFGGGEDENLLKLSTSRKGYLYVGLWDPTKKKQKKMRVHRLVAMTFIPNPNNLPYINHKSGNVTDNSVDNLEWITNKDNQLHGFYILKHFGNTKPIKCLETGKIYESAQQAAKELGICSRSISYAAQQEHKTRTAGGLHWTRLDNV